jgi:hypothetical protein
LRRGAKSSDRDAARINAAARTGMDLRSIAHTRMVLPQVIGRTA